MTDPAHLFPRSRSRRPLFLLIPVLAAAVALAAGCLAPAGRAPAMPGRLVDVDGSSIHVLEGGRHAGSDVVLESGLGGGSFAWGWIQPQVERFAHVISYDRLGLGWSSSSGTRRDADAVVSELHSLLSRIHAHAPYILVGHSLGGLFVLRYAELYPEEVRGIVLLDAVNPRIVSDNMDTYDLRHPWSTVAIGEMLSYVGLVSLLGIPPELDLLPPDSRRAAHYFIRSPDHWSGMLHEAAAFDLSLREAGAARSVGDIPIAVLTAGRNEPRGWSEWQRGLSGYTSRPTWLVLRQADHLGLVADPVQAEYAIRAIRALHDNVGVTPPRSTQALTQATARR